MPEYRYQAKDEAGKAINGTITAIDENTAVNMLRRQNLVVTSLKEAKKGGGAAKGGGGLATLLSGDISTLFGGKPTPRVSSQDMVVFTRQLATMLSAGIPLMECLEILQEQAEDKGFEYCLGEVVSDVRSGSDLSESLKKHPKVFTRIYVNMIKAGEASGQLEEILNRLAEYQEAAEELKGEIKSAMTYPVISLCLVFGITTFLLVGIVPKFEKIFSALQVELPAITKYLLKLSHSLTTNLKMWAGGLVLVVGSIYGYFRTEMGARHKDILMLKMPVFGDLFRKVAISRFSRTFATLIQSGVPILAALEIVASTSGNKLIEDAVLDSAESVRQGETLAKPLSRGNIFPPMVTRMIAIGEKSGALETLLEKISEFYDQQVHQTVKSLTSLIEPIMIAVMGVVVGGIVLAVFLPIFKIQAALTKGK